MPKPDEATLFDILDAATLALEFRGDADFVAFGQDRKTQAAVLHQLLVIGEAVKRLSDGFQQQQPHVPWSLWAKMWDRLIHGYDSVDLTIVWQTVNDDIVSLIADLRAMGPPHQ